MSNPFFRNHGPILLLDIFKNLNIVGHENKKNIRINDIKDLFSSNNSDITFFHSKKYVEVAKNTKASFCITTETLKKELPIPCVPLIVENVLVSVSKITSIFYPDAVNDDFDNTAININEIDFKDTIIEKNVSIGNNCSIGSNTIIRNSLINNNVKILDNCVVGKHGFGFFPNKINNLRYPHIGIVIIEENCEIGCGSTIDRGSMSNTVIGKNTYLDNQIHIAHNVKIGENTIIAGQVGIAGSSIIGSNVRIGGQAGISGHINVGNNVEIGGGSGVIKNIPDNTKVMGYPAKNIRQFLKENK